MKVCPVCGSYNEDFHDFCIKCNNELPTQDFFRSQSHPDQYPSQEHNGEYFKPLPREYQPQHLQDTIDEGQWTSPPSSYTSSKNGRKKGILVLLIVVILIFAILAVLFLMGVFKPLRIVSVYHEPEDPQPGEEIMITAVVEGIGGCELEYRSYFSSRSGGGGTMREVGGGLYEHKIGPFDDGTEVWYMVKSSGMDSFIVSDEYYIQIGEIERSDISSLSISNIRYSPLHPTTKDSSITVQADVRSNITITSVEMEDILFYQSGGGGGGGGMLLEDGVTHRDTISIRGYPEGARIFFKIVAKDESNNTAVSVTISLTLS